MRIIESEPQLSLMDGLYKRDRQEEHVVQMLLDNISNIRYVRDQTNLSLIPDEIRLSAVKNFNWVLGELASMAYEAAQYLPSYKSWSRADFKLRTVSRSDLGLSETRSLDELYDLTIRAVQRLKTALNRFDDVVGEGGDVELGKIQRTLYDTAYLFDVI